MPLKRAQSIKDESTDDESAGTPPRKSFKSGDYGQRAIATWVTKLDSGIKHEPLETKAFDTKSTKEEDTEDDDCNIPEGLTAGVALARDIGRQDGMSVDLGHSETKVTSDSESSIFDHTDDTSSDGDSLFNRKASLLSPHLSARLPPLTGTSLTSSSHSGSIAPLSPTFRERCSATPYPPSGLGCNAATSSTASSQTMEQEPSTATFREIIRIGGHTGLTRIQHTLNHIDSQISDQRAIIFNGQTAINALNRKRETVQKVRADLEDLEHRATEILHAAREAIMEDNAE